MVIPGFVLAGGASSRMGFDKARAPWGSLPMAIHVAEQVASVCASVTLIRRGRADGLPWLRADGSAAHVIHEPDEGRRHPLRGVLEALDRSSGPLLVTPCDVPRLRPEHFARLVERARAPGVVATDGERSHPLVAVLWPELRPVVEELFRVEGPARRLADGLDAVALPAEALVNLNRPDQLPPTSLDRLWQARRWSSDDARARALEGERVRLAAWGVLPPPVRDRVEYGGGARDDGGPRSPAAPPRRQG